MGYVGHGELGRRGGVIGAEGLEVLPGVRGVGFEVPNLVPRRQNVGKSDGCVL